MLKLWGWIKVGYLAMIEPIVEFSVRHRISPNVITTAGTLCTCVAGYLFARGNISIAGWTLGLTAFLDVVDGTVARRTGQSTVFGAFWDSTLDRVADGALFGGLTYFYATDDRFRSGTLVVVCLVALMATMLTSYTRARAEGLGVEMKGVGLMERPERIALLSAPQAFFGLALDGWILATVIAVLATTACITFVQRIRHVARVTADAGSVA
ncbi:MAG: CDP-alcohol phosphatidyltransferase family protein [Gemmatimonadaceae bacterium]